MRIMRAKPLPKTELIKWKGADGKEIEGLLTYPLNYKPGTKVPFILNVHGGPAGVFQQTCVAGNSGAYPIAAFAEMGYAVLRPNPRVLQVMELNSARPIVPIGAEKILLT